MMSNEKKLQPPQQQEPGQEAAAILYEKMNKKAASAQIKRPVHSAARLMICSALFRGILHRRLDRRGRSLSQSLLSSSGPRPGRCFIFPIRGSLLSTQVRPS